MDELKNGILLTFGRFRSCDIACAAANLLISHDWDMAYVKDDPIGSFGGEYWVFKIINNKLIFDSKFNSSESAVEYLEINSRCNDYHNNVLNKKKRKPKYADVEIDSVVVDRQIPNIHVKNDKYVVKFKPSGKVYGEFNSIDEAIAAKQLLIKNNWKISDSTVIEFHKSFYWVFTIDYNVLSFIDKFESYEDALDCIDSLNVYSHNQSNTQSVFGGHIRKIDDEYIENIKNDDYFIENNFIKSNIDESRLNSRFVKPKELKFDDVNNKPPKSSKFPKRRASSMYYDSKDVELIRKEVIRENIAIKEIDADIDESLNDKFQNLKSPLNIIKFEDNTLVDYYTISHSSDGEVEFSYNLYEFKEFPYILKLLNLINLDLNQLKFVSSIHYFNDAYHIIKVFDDKLIISSEFESYSEAEDNIQFLYGYYSKSLKDENYPHDIEHYGKIFSLTESHNGHTFEFMGFNSLEELKAVIDIYNYNNWDSRVFKKYDLFYYNGMYWDIGHFYYNVKLSGRFYSKKDALDHKCR